jgi:hypothetical protein
MTDFEKAWENHPARKSYKRSNENTHWVELGFIIARDLDSEAVKRLRALEGGAVMVLKSDGRVRWSLKELKETSSSFRDTFFSDFWEIQDPKPKRIPEVQDFANKTGLPAKWVNDTSCWYIKWKGCWHEFPHLGPKWEGPEEDSLHVPEDEK